MPRLTTLLFGIAGLLCQTPAMSQTAALADADAVPQLDARGKEGYQQFLAAPLPRAFAIAPGGAWGWATGAASSDLAEQEALDNCRGNTQQRCQLYARDRSVVFNSDAWARSWGPYKNKAEARAAKVGTLRGERFPDLLFRDGLGKPTSLAKLRGQVVVLHFWGSWCPPCKREMPELAGFIRANRQTRGTRFVLLQVREDFASAKAWAARIDPGLPLYDSGARGGSDDHFKLAGGGQVGDRAIAQAFPTTYVIDKYGIVVFAHVGPVTGWEQLSPLLRDVATRSGQ
jgi:thiol-disulfide isomerase/thioredoxin